MIRSAGRKKEDPKSVKGSCDKKAADITVSLARKRKTTSGGDRLINSDEIKERGGRNSVLARETALAGGKDACRAGVEEIELDQFAEVGNAPRRRYRGPQN